MKIEKAIEDAVAKNLRNVPRLYFGGKGFFLALGTEMGDLKNGVPDVPFKNGFTEVFNDNSEKVKFSKEDAEELEKAFGTITRILVDRFVFGKGEDEDEDEDEDEGEGEDENESRDEDDENEDEDEELRYIKESIKKKLEALEDEDGKDEGENDEDDDDEDDDDEDDDEDDEDEDEDEDDKDDEDRGRDEVRKMIMAILQKTIKTINTIKKSL